MKITKKQYMDGEFSHHKYYSQFVTEGTKRFVLRSLTIEQIQEALDSGDEHLNGLVIPYNRMGRGGGWWWDDAPCNRTLMKEVGESNMGTAITCVAKACAKLLVNKK